MKVGLNVPTTYRIAQTLLNDIAGFGFDHVRVDVPPSGDLRPFVEDYVGAAVRPLFLLHDVSRNEPLLDVALPYGTGWFDLQVWNEPPTMDKIDLATYIQGIQIVWQDSRTRGFAGDLLMGGMANPDRENREWIRLALQSMPTLDQDPNLVVDEHRYAYKTQDDWSRPWPPHATRENEIRTFTDLARGRGTARTEIGWHTAQEQIGFQPFQLTDEQATQNYVKDFSLYDSLGVDRVTVFQLNDGPNDTWGNRQGIRYYPDGPWKPQAEAVKIWRSLHGSI